jgi:hypothetical protein
LASLPEVRSINLPANRQAGAKGAYGWAKSPVCGAAFFDLYTDPREEGGKMLPTFPAKGMFNVRTVR